MVGSEIPQASLCKFVKIPVDSCFPDDFFRVPPGEFEIFAAKRAK